MTALGISPGEDSSRRRGARLRRVWSGYLARYWKALAFLVALNLVVSGLAAAPPFLIGATADAVIGDPAREASAIPVRELDLGNIGAAAIGWLGLQGIGDRFQLVLVLMGLYAAVRVLESLGKFGIYLLALWVRVRSSRDLQRDLFAHILSLPIGFFNRQRSGDLVARLENDTDGVTDGIEKIAQTLVTAPLLVLFYGWLLVATSPQLVAVAALAVGLHLGISRGLQDSLRRRVRDHFTAFAALTAALQETISGIRVVKSFAAERFEMGKLRQSIERILRINMRYGVYKHVHEPIQGSANALIEVGIALAATYHVIQGSLSATAAVMFFYVGQRLIQPVTDLGTAWLGIHSVLASAERIFEILETVPSVESGSERPAGFRDELRIEGLSFAYDREPVLRGVELAVRKGEHVALVGPSGAGKSTLTDLVLRFYDPDQGRISLDGVDIRRFVQADYRRLFGVVPQETLLFDATVAENIGYARPGLSEAEVRRAAEIANAHEFVEKLPDGYQTLVGERGVRLSGGQRQRIAIARAIASQPSILILDEATSALDSESERQVQRAIDKVIEGMTAIVIAHRLSTILGADRIVVMDEGRVLDCGRHEELLSRCDLYRRLCRLQFGLGAPAPA